jgi:transcription elongation factor GreA
LSRLEEAAAKKDSSGFEKEWEEAVRSGVSCSELAAALDVLSHRGDSELALLLAETTAEELDSAGDERVYDFVSRAALLFESSDVLSEVLAEAVRDRHAVWEPLEGFIQASGLLNRKKSLRESWLKLRGFLLFQKGCFVLHREFGPGEIVRVSRSSFTVDFQRARNHDMSIGALVESTRPIEEDSLYVMRWRKPDHFRNLLETAGQSFLQKVFEEVAVDGSLKEVNLFRLLEGSDIPPKTVWRAVKSAAAESPNYMLMGDAIMPADNSSLLNQVQAVLETRRMPMSERTKTIISLMKAADGAQAATLAGLFDSVVEISDIEKGAVFELAWLCSARGSLPGFQEKTNHLVERTAARAERAVGEIHSAQCKKLYLQLFFMSNPERAEAEKLLTRLPRNLREQASDTVAEANPELHESFIRDSLSNPGETEQFMWALERAASLGDFIEPEAIVGLALKNLGYAKSDMQRRICTLLMDSLRAELEQHISLLDTRRLETLTESLEESIGAQESGLVLLARRELSGRRTGGFTNIRKFWEDDHVFSSRDSISRRKEQMAEIKATSIPEAARAIAEAASHGDLSENAEYTAALEKRDFLLELLNRYNTEMKLLRPYPVGEISTEIISPATRVLLESMDDDGENRIVFIVGPLDSDAEKNCINYKAPLGAALLGLSKGDTVQLPGERNNTWRVTEISVMEELL